MRILKLKFKNINSLAGENEIDFTNSVFTNDGLFAITGKTGAGKSSILDAIALAFYGKTPRVEISGNENAVMTRGEKDCYAEINFEVEGKIWKSAWKQERTKTGNLKPVNRIISDADGIIIADQVRACDTKIIEIIGLSFEQFTKVIMLAQGSFAAFLQADKNDKGELLEQITGTEIYGEISKKVFERNRIEKEKLEKILLAVEAIKVLSDEETNTLENEISLLEKEKKYLEKELQNLESVRKWLLDLSILQKQIQDAKQNLPALEEIAKRTKSKIEQAEKSVLISKETLSKHEPIFKQVRELDTKIAIRQNLLKPILDTLASLGIENKSLQHKIEKYKEQLLLTNKKLIEKEDWKANHLKYETLLSQFAAIEKEHLSLQLENQSLTKINNEIVGLNQTLNQKKVEATLANESYHTSDQRLTLKNKELEERKQELLNVLAGKELSELQSEKEKITNFGTELKGLIETEMAILKSQGETAEYDQNLLLFDKETYLLEGQIEIENTSITNLNLQIKLLEENILLNRTILSLAEHRQHLKDGEACPLCGAIEHPYAIGNIPSIGNQEQALFNLKSELDQKTKVKSTQEIKLAEVGSNRNNNIALKAKAEKQLQELIENLLKQKKALVALNHGFVYPEASNKIEVLQTLLTSKQNDFKNIKSNLDKATEIEKEITDLRDQQLPILIKERQKAEQGMMDIKLQLSLIEQDIVSKNELAKTLQEKHNQAANSFLNGLKYYEVDTIESLKKCLEDWTFNQKSIEELTKDKQALNNQLTIFENNFNNGLSQLKEKEKERGEIEIEKSDLTLARLEIFGEKQVDKEESMLKNQLQEAEFVRDEADKSNQTASIELTKIEAIFKEKEKELIAKQSQKLSEKAIEEIEITLKEKKQNSDFILQKIGANQQAINANALALKERGIKFKEKVKQQETCNKWSNLDRLIGASDGRKYRNFAQALTFEHLIALANKQLQKMSERYLLKRTGEISNPFELSVVDKFQNNEERTAQNLSGGEKFIVSLSLALGLSNMASKNMRIDTLFIDEGFGTLDSDYLDVALSALSNLQSEGKIIGVISHLSELKERIATHVEVIPSGNGYSKIQITN